MGSARETRACLEVAQALGYVEDAPVLVADKLDRVLAMLHKLTR